MEKKTFEQLIAEYKPELTTHEQVEQGLAENQGRFTVSCVTIWETNYGYCVRDLVMRGAETRIFSKAQKKSAFNLAIKLS